MKFLSSAILLTLFLSINALPYAVIEVAKVASPVGSHGPALINLHWPNSWPGSYWGKGHGGWGNDGANNGGNDGANDGNWGGNSGNNNDGWGHSNVGYTGDAGHGHDGKYVAINRGSIHVAPLVGHHQSVKSQNYQPAPGTNW